MPRRRRKVKSRTRGAASAPKWCKDAFKKCMRVPATRGAGKVAKDCLLAFNSCRLGRKRKGTARLRRAAA